jgi:hypothetical protein
VPGEPFAGSLPASTEVPAAPSAPRAAGTRTVEVLLLAPDDGDCGAVRPVQRRVPDDGAVATQALRELFGGRTTDQERAAGLQSPFGPATADLLRQVRVVDGTAYVDLDGGRRRAIDFAGTSCGGQAFFAVVVGTLRQFPTVTQVRFAFDGDPRDFVQWSQGGCPDEPVPPGDPCDPRPWQPARPGSGPTG